MQKLGYEFPKTKEKAHVVVVSVGGFLTVRERLVSRATVGDVIGSANGVGELQ